MAVFWRGTGADVGERTHRHDRGSDIRGSDQHAPAAGPIRRHDRDLANRGLFNCHFDRDRGGRRDVSGTARR